MEKILHPKKETLTLKGNLIYGEGNRAWSIIKLKSDMIKEFPQLKERQKRFGYKLIMHRSFSELKKDKNDLDIS